MKKLIVGICATLLSVVTAFATPQWSAWCYKTTDAEKPELSLNTLLGKSGVTFEFTDNGGIYDKALTDPSCLYSGTLDYQLAKGKSFAIASKAKMNITFPKEASVSAIRLFSFHGDGGRDGINIGAIKVKRTANGAWEDLGASQLQYSIGVSGVSDTEDRGDGYYNMGNNTGGCCYLALTDSEGGALAEDIFGLRIEFSTMDNGSTNFDEIEICGSLSKGAVAKLNRVNSSYVVDAKLDTEYVSSADFTLKKTDSDGTETQETLATGVTSSDWVSYPISGIDANKSYLVKMVVSSGDTVYGTINLGSICPSEVSLSAEGPIDVNTGDKATVTVTRASDAVSTKYPLVVNLAFSGEAKKDVDFSATSSVTIPAGESSASTVISPLLNAEATGDLTFTVSVASGGYPTSSGSEEISVAKPNWGWTLDTSAKTITERVESGTPWVINVNISGTDLTLTSVKTEGSSTVVDFRNVVATEAGEGYKIVSSSSTFYGKAITKIYLPASMMTIGAFFCRECKSLTEVVLPEGVTRIENAAFYQCTALKTVTPFLPETVSYVGPNVFNGCSALEGELVFALKLSSATLDGESPFNGCKKITKAYLGDGLSVIPVNCFLDCTGLEYVKLPAKLTKLDNSGSFARCTSLRVVEPFLPETLTTVCQCAFMGCTSLTQPLKFWPLAEINLTATDIFSGCGAKSLPEVDLGVNVKSIGNNFLANTKSVKRVVMRNPTMTWTGSSFSGWDSYQCVFVISRDQTTWNGENLSDVLTPWADLDAETQAKFTTAFPYDPQPRGLIKQGKYPQYQWVVSFGYVTPGEKNLTINGLPEKFGASSVSPTYGVYKKISVPMEVSAPRYTPNEVGGNILYECKGYVMEASGDFGWETPVTNLFVGAEERTVSYTTDTDGDKRLSWLWEPVAYSVSIVQPTDPTVGSVTVSKGSLEGYFKKGETATVTAVDGNGTFVKWHGDVPAGHEADNPLLLEIDGPKTLTPEFTQPWVWDSSAGTISDGYWVLNATRSNEGEYTIGSPVSVDTLGVLDLTKKMADGGSITKIANSAFNNSQSRIIVEVRLPETLKEIGQSAFAGNTALKTVTPFLPSSVNTIGSYAFQNCSSLESELFLAKDGGNITFNGSWETCYFQSTAIPKVTVGPDVTRLPDCCFNNCTKLKKVTLGKSIEKIYANALSSCSVLETIEPFLPASVTYIGNSAFASCPKLTGTVYIGTNGVEMTLGNSIFQSSGSDAAYLGEGVLKIPASMFHDNKRLKSVTMSDKVTEIGGDAFRQCNELISLTPFLPSSITKVDPYAFYLSKNIASPLVLESKKVKGVYPVIDLPLGSWNNGAQFSYCTKVPSIVLGEVHKLYGCAFEQMYAVTNFYFKGSVPFEANGSGHFAGWAARQSRWFIPRTGWESWLETNVTPWADVSDDDKAAYQTAFPGEKKVPYGMVKSGYLGMKGAQWAFLWSPNASGFSIIIR